MQAIIDPTSIRVIYDFDKISNQDTYNYENNDMIVCPRCGNLLITAGVNELYCDKCKKIHKI